MSLEVCTLKAMENFSVAERFSRTYNQLSNNHRQWGNKQLTLMAIKTVVCSDWIGVISPIMYALRDLFLRDGSILFRTLKAFYIPFAFLISAMFAVICVLQYLFTLLTLLITFPAALIHELTER